MSQQAATQQTTAQQLAAAKEDAQYHEGIWYGREDRLRAAKAAAAQGAEHYSIEKLEQLTEAAYQAYAQAFATFTALRNAA